MIAIDIFLLVVVFGIVGAVIYSRNSRLSIQAQTQPSAELARAVRIIDLILAADSALPSIPEHLHTEAQAFVRSYYKEIENP